MKKFVNLLLTALAGLSMILSSLGSATVLADENAPGANDKYDIVLTKIKMTDL